MDQRPHSKGCGDGRLGLGALGLDHQILGPELHVVPYVLLDLRGVETQEVHHVLKEWLEVCVVLLQHLQHSMPLGCCLC